MGLSAKEATSTDAFSAGNDAYMAADYHEAVRLYHKALKEGPSAEVYYNLGNAYYRIDNIPKAILYYEKAAKLRPMDRDIRHNIDIAQKKTEDNLTYDSDVFLVQWYHYLQSIFTINGWAYLAIASFVSALICFLLYLFAGQINIRRISFYSFVLLLLFTIICNVTAWQRYHRLTQHTDAIAISGEVSVKTSPTLKSNDVCKIHEGTKVNITDHDIKGWYGIHLSDGREGWIERKYVEDI